MKSDIARPDPIINIFCWIKGRRSGKIGTRGY
jgi:hypothetical protein